MAQHCKRELKSLIPQRMGKMTLCFSPRILIVLLLVRAFLFNSCTAQVPNIHKPDLFDSLVSSGASFDTDSPVEARAEFDPPVASVGSKVSFRLEVTALDESLTVPDTLPAPAGMELRAGGRGQTYQTTPAFRSQARTTVIYRVTVTNTGTFTMPPFEVTAYGKPVKVPAATLTILPKETGVDAQSQRLTIVPPKEAVYVGQLVKLLLELPNDSANGGFLGMSQPHVSGDYIFMEPSPRSGMRQVLMSPAGGNNRNGAPSSPFVQEVAITPLRAGDQEIVAQVYAVELKADANQPNIRRTSNRLVDSEPITLTVKPLPTNGIPASFTGAVGDFKVGNYTVQPSQARVGEPLTIFAEIMGDGNLARLIPFELPQMHDWQVFPPKRDGSPDSIIQQRGSVIFKYNVIPMTEHVIATPGIPFGYFDPNSGSYQELVIPPIPVNILTALAAPASNPLMPVAPAAPKDEATNAEPVLVLNETLATTQSPVSTLVPLQNRPGFWLVQLIPALMLGGIWAWRSRKEYLAAHPEVILKAKARRGLRRELKLARKAADARDASIFARHSANALREVCAPFAAANPQALVCADILQAMDAQEPSNGRDEIIRRVFTAADAGQFGGRLDNSEELLGLQPQLEKILQEQRLRL